MIQFKKRSCDLGLQSYGRFCAQVQSKSWKRVEKVTFQAIVKEVSCFACFDDQDHQNWNFTVSVMVVSIIL